MLPEQLKLIVIKQTGKQFNIVKELLRRKYIQEIVIATDAGREGELVGRWILEKANTKKPAKRLWTSSLMEKKGKDIFITSKGRQLLDLVPEDLKSPALIAEWEEKLGLITNGSLNKEVFINDIKNYSRKIVKDIKNSEEVFKHGNLTRNRCSECGEYMLEVKGKKGKMLIYKDRECGHRKGLTKATNARCPECRKKLDLRGKGEGQIFVCKCGFKEKLSSFNKKRGNQKAKVSKKDVSKYIKKQKKKEEEPLNTALADALAKLKEH